MFNVVNTYTRSGGKWTGFAQAERQFFRLRGCAERCFLLLLTNVPLPEPPGASLYFQLIQGGSLG